MIATEKTERERLQARLRHLQSRLAEQMKGRFVASPKAVKTQEEIQDIHDELKRLESRAVDRLNFEKMPTDEVLAILTIPLLADVMNLLTAELNGTLRRHGVAESVFGDYSRKIQRISLQLMDKLALSELGMLIDLDDTIVESVSKKLKNYVKQRLKLPTM